MDEVDVRRIIVDQDFGMHIFDAAQTSLVAIGKQYFKLWTKEKERKEAIAWAVARKHWAKEDAKAKKAKENEKAKKENETAKKGSPKVKKQQSKK